LVEYILRDFIAPEARNQVVNIGCPDEYTMNDFARKVIDMTGSRSEIVYRELPSDDPTRRRPDITKAKALLQYSPQVGLDEGLRKTIEWFKNNS
jgi:nucleoside-diphosphate-sugar epimerase